MPCPPKWDLSPKEAKVLQSKLAGSVVLQPLPDRIEILGASDIGYVPALDKLAAVVITFRWPSLELIETAHVVQRISFPYIPGLLSFREIPPLLEAYRQLEHPPDVLLCDGQGIAHPRRLGLASHLGLCLDIPTVGCAKKLLCGKHGPLGPHRGDLAPLELKGDIIGYVLRTRDGIKPVYISPGHLADLESSRELIQSCLGRYRIPEPLRRAHQLATTLRSQLTL